MNLAIAQMDRVTQQNASLVEETASASEALRDQAASLAEAVNAFRLDAATAAPPVEARIIPLQPAAPAPMPSRSEVKKLA